MMIKIDDNTRLVRFLKGTTAEKAIGIKRPCGVEYIFHFGLLSDYQKMENNAGDTEEGRPKIKFENGAIGTSACYSEVLVSCWSIWEEGDDPWASFSDSSFAKVEDGYVWAITSTVGKIRREIERIVEFNKMLFGDKYNRIVCFNFDAHVVYYSEKDGLDYSQFREATDPVINKDTCAQTRAHVLSKRDMNPKKKQRYDAEREYRFAIVLSPGSFHETGIKINVKHVIMKNYPIHFDKGAHYIDTIYTKFGGRDLLLASINDEQDLCDIKQKVKKQGMPILLKRGEQFILCGYLKDEWKEKTLANFLTPQEIAILSKLDFPSSLIKSADISRELADILKKGQAFFLPDDIRENDGHYQRINVIGWENRIEIKHTYLCDLQRRELQAG